MRRRSLAAIAAVWIVAAAATLVVTRVTHVGPVLLRLMPGHGVHLGDLGALIDATVAATVVTVVVVRRNRRARARATAELLRASRRDLP